MHQMWRLLIPPFNKMTVMLFTQCLCKTSNFHRTLLTMWLIHVCAVLPGYDWLLWLTWNNGKFLTLGPLLNGARRLDHCDIIALLAPLEEQSWYSKPNIIYGNSLGPTTSVCNIWIEISNPAGQFMSLIQCHLLWLQLFKYRRNENAQ